MAAQTLQLRSLGNTGLKLSSVGFGASPLGKVFGDVSEQDAFDAVREAFRLGVNFFDTSPYIINLFVIFYLDLIYPADYYVFRNAHIVEFRLYKHEFWITSAFSVMSSGCSLISPHSFKILINLYYLNFVNDRE